MIGNLRSTIVDNSVTLLVQFSSVVLEFLIRLVLARRLGAGGFGSYSYAVAWLLPLTTLATLGTQRLLVREIPRYLSRGDVGDLRGLVRRSQRTVLVASLSLVAIVIVVLRVLSSRIPFANVLTFALFPLPLLSLLYLNQATLQGLHHVLLGQVERYVLRPAVLLSLLLIVPVLPFFSLTPTAALLLYGFSVAVAWALSVRSSHSKLETYTGDLAPVYATSVWSWLKATLPLLVNSFLIMTQQRLDILLLGPLSSPEDVGLYSVAAQMSFFVAFGFGAISIPFAPRLARLYGQDDVAGAQELSNRTTLWGLALALPPAAIFLIFGRPILRIFGPAFPDAYGALVILVVGQLFQVVTGPVGYLLLMARLERYNVLVGVLSSTVHVVLLFLLIPPLLLRGAALATGITIVLRNLAYAFLVYRRLGIVSGPFLVLRPLRALLRS